MQSQCGYALVPPTPANRFVRETDPRDSDVPAMSGVVRRIRSFGGLVAGSEAMHHLFTVLDRLAPTSVTITIAGETGTGKDVAAQAIHANSPRASEPFVVFDCGAVAANLAESELFGHEKGSFTGAAGTHAGAFERACGGTLFLDEIGELPLELQPRLLRALENRRVRRVGGASDRAVNVRVLAATNRNLRAEVAEGRFREDLYFRLAGAVVTVPPLRDRLDDLPLLVPKLLSSLERGEVAVRTDLFDILRRHHWPGNIRELKNLLSCALAFVDENVLEPRHLELGRRCTDSSGTESLALGGQSLQAIERAAIKQTLALNRGNKVSAARTLGIAVSTLYEKVRRYEL